MKYPIQVVAKQTGLTAATLRMWEKRYEGIVPERDSHGRRLYSQELLTRLKLLAALVRDGYRISDLVSLDISELARLHRMLSPDRAMLNERADSDDLERAVEAVLRMDTGALNSIMNAAIVAHGQLDVVDRLIFPLVTRVEQLAANGAARQVHVSMLHAALQALLVAQLPAAEDRDGRPVVAVAVPHGQSYSVGAIASMIHVVAAGWYPVMLGTDVLAEDMAAAVRTVGARALLIASVTDSHDAELERELATVRELISDDVPILFGGRMPERLVAELEGAGLRYMTNMNTLRATLRSLAA